jgi:hypothetical protein
MQLKFVIRNFSSRWTVHKQDIAGCNCPAERNANTSTVMSHKSVYQESWINIRCLPKLIMGEEIEGDAMGGTCSAHGRDVLSSE